MGLGFPGQILELGFRFGCRGFGKGSWDFGQEITIWFWKLGVVGLVFEVVLLKTMSGLDLVGWYPI